MWRIYEDRVQYIEPIELGSLGAHLIIYSQPFLKKVVFESKIVISRVSFTKTYYRSRISLSFLCTELVPMISFTKHPKGRRSRRNKLLQLNRI